MPTLRHLLHKRGKVNTGLHRGVVDWLGVATGESLRQATMRSKSCNIRESACPGLLGGSGVILAEDDCFRETHMTVGRLCGSVVATLCLWHVLITTCVSAGT